MNAPGLDPAALLSRFLGRNALHLVFGHPPNLPWLLTKAAAALVSAHIERLGSDYRIENGVALHATAHVEDGAIVKGPAIIGPRAFIAATAYLRGGVFLDEDCIIGPAAELKSSFLFKGTKLAHLNFVGDSILGENVNCEAGSMIANFRNESSDKLIRIAVDGRVVDTGVDKFGALVGDGTRLGANAVIAPGALIAPQTIIPRLGLMDQRP
jgi:UDP-N-acetylglucosamine diphosphorylase / glucose-1-phosphate thymidylyltransferase / UDP-N-acetylgalactosamine diphosphorylase / glucosamine-1-phosphate N-acetyltransferase / galactosamine-1-phosphate N-acetyltransferase